MSRKKPEWRGKTDDAMPPPTVRLTHIGDADASIFAPTDNMEPNAYATAATPALSLCAALIRAKMEEDDAKP